MDNDNHDKSLTVGVVKPAHGGYPEITGERIAREAKADGRAPSDVGPEVFAAIAAGEAIHAPPLFKWERREKGNAVSAHCEPCDRLVPFGRGWHCPECVEKHAHEFDTLAAVNRDLRTRLKQRGIRITGLQGQLEDAAAALGGYRNREKGLQDALHAAQERAIEQRVIINDLRANGATIDHNYAKLRADLEDANNRLTDREKQLAIVRTWMVEWNETNHTVTSGIEVLRKRLTWADADPLAPLTSNGWKVTNRMTVREIRRRIEALEGRLRGLDQEADGHDGIESLIGAFRTASDRNRKCFTDVDVKAADLAKRCAKLEEASTAPSPLADLDMDSIIREAISAGALEMVREVMAEKK